MILDLKPWKNELKKTAQSLDSWVKEYQNLSDAKACDYWNKLEAVNFGLEKGLFYSALAIRRMLETHNYTVSRQPNTVEIAARCLPEKLLSKNIQLQVQGSPHYSKETISYKDLASEIIHSGNLSWHEVGEDFRGFWLASEKNENRRVFLVPWQDYLCFLSEFYDAPTRKVA